MRNESVLHHLAGLTLLLSLALAASAQESELGRLWTFENPPLGYIDDTYGFAPDQAWLDALRLGSLRLGSDDIGASLGSASFVSPEGLILTSTRCVRDAVVETIRKLGRTPDGHPLKTKAGFVASSPHHEIRLRARSGWLSAAQLRAMSDVTDAVNDGVALADDDMGSKARRDANKQAILEAASKAEPSLVPQIVSLHQGTVFRLYQYKVYDDIRLVCMPQEGVAHFGGDHDDFTVPRSCVDFAFLRAYEDGKPADTSAHHFTLSSGGAKGEELVFVSGSPGTTRRLLTTAQLELERDIRIPMRIEWYVNRLATYGPLDLDAPIYSAFRSFVLELQNGLKATRARLEGLEDPRLMSRKHAAEQAFRNRVAADEQLAEEYADLWDRIENLVAARRRHEAQAMFHAPSNPVLQLAVEIVRLCDPAESDERRRHAKATLEAWSATVRPAWPGTAHADDQFVRARTWLRADDPLFTKVLANRSFEAFKGSLEPGSPTWLGEPEQRDALVEAGWEAIQRSDDPQIVAARELVILMRRNAQISAALDAREEALVAELGRAMLATTGPHVSPDGTATPRFTAGVIRGIATHDTAAPDYTTLADLYARSAAHDDEPPFALPQIWRDRRARLDLSTPVNFFTTTDIAGVTAVYTVNVFGTHSWRHMGGSSGSVVVNRDLEVVGVVIDGTVKSLQDELVWGDGTARTVSTHVDVILEALVKIYDAHRLVEELTGD